MGTRDVFSVLPTYGHLFLAALFGFLVLLWEASRCSLFVDRYSVVFLLFGYSKTMKTTTVVQLIFPEACLRSIPYTSKHAYNELSWTAAGT